MPQPPAPRPARTDAPTVPHLEPPSVPVAAAPPAKELSVNKIVAGAGAAATTAVLGSFFGAAGTVAGAALGSVASTVATTIYQRSLDRTRETIVARIRPVAGARVGDADATVRLRVEPAVPPARPRRRWAVWVGATALVFLLGLLAVTGIEWIKGSTITAGDSGTSVGRVLGADPATPAPTEAPSPTSDVTETSTPDPTSSADPVATPSRTTEPSGNTPRSGVESTGSPTTAAVPGPGGLLPRQG